MSHYTTPTALVLALLAMPLGAQSQIATFPGAAPGDHHSVVLGGVDLDGDGFDDLVVGAPDDDTAGTGAGAVYAYSGQTKTLIWAQYGNDPIASFGHALAFTLDMDGDGVPELVVGAPFARHPSGIYPGKVSVHSGADGTEDIGIWGDNHNDGMGWSVAGGFSWGANPATFAGGAPFNDDDNGQGGLATNSGSITIASGSAGYIFAEGTIHGDAAGDLFGWSMSNVGDIDADFASDLAVGAPGADFVKGDVGLVRTYSWGAPFWTKTGLASGDQMGAAIAPAGDLDGDGIGDILVGEPGNADNGALAGRVRAFKGSNSNQLGVWRGDGAGDLFGTSLALLDSLDGDVTPDWAMGAPQTGVGAGYVRVFSSNPPGELFTLHGDAVGDEFGSSVSGAGFPLGGTNASTPAIAVGAPGFDGAGGNETGMARLYLGSCPGITSYCTAGVSATGCQATLQASGIPSASAPTGFQLVSNSVEGDKDGLFFFGSNGRQAAPWGNGTSYQCVVPPVRRGGVLSGQGSSDSCTGYFVQDLNELWTSAPPKNPGAGAVVQAQLWYRDPFNTSNQTTSLSSAVEFVVCP